jgi:transcriptional regulator with XRE-family HTH domain
LHPLIVTRIILKSNNFIPERTKDMWLDNLKELKKAKGMTTKQIADATKIPEGTIKRIFAGDTIDPYVSTIHRIVIALGGSLDHVLADTNAVLAPESVAEAKEIADVAEAERDLIAVENDRLKAQNLALTTENELLKKELAHKEELLALHNYYKIHIEQLIKKEGI